MIFSLKPVLLKLTDKHNESDEFYPSYSRKFAGHKPEPAKMPATKKGAWLDELN